MGSRTGEDWSRTTPRTPRSLSPDRADHPRVKAERPGDLADEAPVCVKSPLCLTPDPSFTAPETTKASRQRNFQKYRNGDSNAAGCRMNKRFSRYLRAS